MALEDTEIIAGYTLDEDLLLIGISLWNIVDADKPNLDSAKKKGESINEKIDPPLDGTAKK